MSLDAKGRMSVPTRHREALVLQCDGRLTLTRHPDGCLLLYPRSVWESVRESAVRRFRPILLTAAAAVLAMVPLSRDVLWGPMAFAIMGGLIVATIMTVLFVPALYVAWYRVRPD